LWRERKLTALSTTNGSEQSEPAWGLPAPFFFGGDKLKTTITKVFTFCYAHRLWNTDFSASENKSCYGICSRLHGHNAKLEVTLIGDVDPKTGFLFNFEDLKDVVNREVIEKLDHQLLNDLTPFTHGQTTAENIIKWIWNVLEKQNFGGCKLHKLRLYETDTSFVELEE